MPLDQTPVTTRAELLRQAAVKLHRAQDCERHMMATTLAWEAGELLRKAAALSNCDYCFGQHWCRHAGPCPTPDASRLARLADRCGDEWGVDVSDVLAEVEREIWG